MTWELLFRTVSYSFLISLILLGADILCAIVYIAALTIRKRQAHRENREDRSVLNSPQYDPSEETANFQHTS